MAEQWVKNTLYSELIASPIWLHAAFTHDSVFSVDQNGIRLIRYFVMTTRAKCPIWDPEKISSYINMDDYTGLFHDAWQFSTDKWRLSGVVAP